MLDTCRLSLNGIDCLNNEILFKLNVLIKQKTWQDSTFQPLLSSDWFYNNIQIETEKYLLFWTQSEKNIDLKLTIVNKIIYL